MFQSIDAIKRANKASDGHFFESGALRFFDSVIGRTVYGGRFFITSERFSLESPRLYTVRKANPDGSIDTVGEFQAYSSRRKAISAIKAIIK